MTGNQQDPPPQPAGARRPERNALLGTAVLGMVVLAIWLFPRIWYTASAAGEKLIWFGERTNLVGWTFDPVPISDSAERLLVADQTVNGEFKSVSSRTVVRAFSAKRYTHKSHDTGLFLHTPDRCWTLAGWKFESVTPDHVELVIHGVRMVFERRIYVGGGLRELVYFGGLVGGQPLPYRLDHNLSVGMRFAATEVQRGRSRGFFARAVDTRLWERVWDGFVARRPLLGPKQFIRISTPLERGDVAAADKVLRDFLEAWLEPVDYQAELAAWAARKS